MDMPDVEMLTKSDDEDVYDLEGGDGGDDDDNPDGEIQHDPLKKHATALTDHERTSVIQRYARVMELKHNKMTTG